jgi:hypothetical protein
MAEGAARSAGIVAFAGTVTSIGSGMIGVITRHLDGGQLAQQVAPAIDRK